MKESTCRYLWQDRDVLRGFTTAISLHSHTQHSQECLGFIPRYARRIPIVSGLVRQQERKYERYWGRELDFDRAWWTPPLAARPAYDLERHQINDKLGLQAFVSLSDHDSIEACTLLQVVGNDGAVPISVEWTVPYGESFFHLGVHNLPPRWAPEVMSLLKEFTSQPDSEKLPDILSTLYGFPSSLIVLNHPLWDEPGIGAAAHGRLLESFLTANLEWIHAFELNGLRDWRENQGVVALARHWEKPVISGGDRHACEPNAIVNLTNASTFAEFAAEVRHDRHSHVLFLDQYREPMKLRILQNLLDVVRDYEDHPEGRRRWSDRVFMRCEDGEIRSMSSYWEGDGPPIVQVFMSAARLLGSRRVRSALRYALAERVGSLNDIGSQGSVLHRFLS